MIPKKTISKTNFSMPVFGLGTWMMGGRFERDLSNDGKSDADSIRRAVDAGVTHIDTAEIYAEGYSEEIVARAVAGYERSKLFLVSKVFKTNLRKDDLLEAAKQSLKRLKTDYLDLYLIHAPNPEVPMEETLHAMATLKEQGLILNIGVSNFTKERVQEAQSYIDYPIVANQVHYNLTCREAEATGLVEHCQNNDVMLIAWRPVQKGMLTKSGIGVLDNICKKYDKTPAQVAINWLVSQSNIVTLSTMRSEEHLRENLSALDWTMESEDIEKLRLEFPNQQLVSDAVPLG